MHGVGGMLGSLLIPFLAGLGPLAPGIGKPILAQFGVQLLAVGVVAVFSAVVTAGLLYAIRTMIPLRVSREDEDAGLDSASHGESAYHQ